MRRCERMPSLVDAARQRRAQQNLPPPRPGTAAVTRGASSVASMCRSNWPASALRPVHICATGPHRRCHRAGRHLRQNVAVHRPGGKCMRMPSMVDAARQRRARQNLPLPRRAGHRRNIRAGSPQAWPQQRVSPASSACFVPVISHSLSALAPCPAPSVTPFLPCRPRPTPPRALPLRDFDGLLRLLHDCSGLLGARHRRSICMPKRL